MSEPARWLMLVHQLPAKPAYARVKVWRLLQESGAVSVKSSVYVLPQSSEARAALSAVLVEINRHGGEGVIAEAQLINGMRDKELRELFNKAREADYDAVTAELRELSRHKRRSKAGLARLSQRLADITRIDFFGASGREPAEALLARLEHSGIVREVAPPKTIGPAQMRGKTWVTRRDIYVDRIASAWLITRFIDPAGTLKFVPGRHYEPLPGEYRYDMQDGEFTHEGDNCSFETLLARSGIKDGALKTIAEMVHDMDLKDGKFGHPETAGIGHVIAGICRTQDSDDARVARGRELFDDIYEQFRRRKEK
jgi:hypothetical protein